MGVDMFGGDYFQNPGLDAFFAGQKRAEDRANLLSNLRTAQVNRQSLLQRMLREAEKHSLDMARTRLENEGLRDTLGVAQQKNRLDMMEKLFNYMRVYGDLDPQKLLQLPPEQRQQVYDKIIERQQAPERRQKEFQNKLDIKKTKAVKDADYNKALMQQDKMTERALQVAKITAEAKTKAAQAKIAGIQNKTYQAYATQILQQMFQTRQMPENTIEEKTAKYQLLTELGNMLDTVVTLDLQRPNYPVQQRQAGQPDLNAMGGIPTVPQPQPFLPGQQLMPQTKGPQQSPQIRGPQQSYVVGQVYTGRTGRYKYKGGDPKNPASWEKIQ